MNQKIKVLVVDDDPDVLFATSRIVKSAGYEVFEASTGAECMKTAREIRPDLILLDVVLPDANGARLCGEIKSDPALKATFVVLISGTETTSLEQADGLEGGADGYIARPVSNRELKARVNAMVRIHVAERDRDLLIVELKDALSRAKTLVSEKEVLLREVHHRVKNNMQVITSLLRLQSSKIEDKPCADTFKDAENRIRSMALIHEKLYQTKDFAKIDFNEYAKGIANHLIRNYSGNAGKIKLNISVENIPIALDKALPCGMIINELISNSLKHAFPKGEAGEIKIVLRQTDSHEIELTVSDDGIGISKGMDVGKTASLGLQIVHLLAENQLDGTLAVDREEGTAFKIRFKDE